MTRISRRAFSSGILTTTLAGKAALAQETPRRGGTLVATWGGGEPQACYVPSGGGPSPTFSSSKLLERLASRRMDGEFQGELAEAWKPSADFRSYAIKIRKGVKFHDGKDMTTDDVVYSIDEIWKKHAAAASLTEFAGVAASDADTVVVRFSKPVPEFFFASLLCGNANYIVPRHVYAGTDPLKNPANDAPIGTGPWKFKQWVIRYLRDPAGRAAAIEAGDIQIGVLNPVEPAEIKRLVATSKFVATAKGYEEAVWSTSFEVNMRNPIFAKREVRQAMFFAVDRNLIAKTVYFGYARPGTGPICSSNTAFFSPDTFSTAFDPKKAAALLDAAGYPKKNGGKRFTLNLLAAGWFAENGKVGAIVKQGLEDVGVGVNLTVPDRATSIRRLYTDYDFDLAISNKASASEPVPSTTQFYTSDGIRKGVPFRNASGFHTDEVDALVEKIKVETDPARRKALVAEFQKIATVECADLPLVELDSITLASTRVRNHSNDPAFPAASWHDIWLAG
jgi:peptide/nickel transport system substrate-binding protein